MINPVKLNIGFRISLNMN